MQMASVAQTLWLGRLMTLPNVRGCGVGFRVRGQRVKREICLQVFVDQKVHFDELPPDARVPASLQTPLGDVFVDVIELPMTWMTIPDTARHRPVTGGSMITTSRGTAGTLGAFARTRQGQVVGLTANHVVTLPNARHLVPANPVVDQQSLAGIPPIGAVAAVSQILPTFHVAGAPVGQPASDAATVSLAPHVSISPIVQDTVTQAIYSTTSPRLGLWVEKRGFSSGYSIGYVVSTNFITHRIHHPPGTGLQPEDVTVGGNGIGFLVMAVGFNELPWSGPFPDYHHRAFARPGDSGSLISSFEQTVFEGPFLPYRTGRPGAFIRRPAVGILAMAWDGASRQPDVNDDLHRDWPDVWQAHPYMYAAGTAINPIFNEFQLEPFRVRTARRRPRLRARRP